jgi:hypothetical protein
MDVPLMLFDLFISWHSVGILGWEKNFQDYFRKGIFLPFARFILKETVAPIRVGLPVVWRERCESREEPPVVYTIFIASSISNFKNCKSCIEEKGQKLTRFADSAWAILPCLLLVDGLILQIFHLTLPIGTFA